MPLPATLPLLFIAATGAGLVDAIAGGGGLITIPALLGVGLPPQLALGTNKLQATCGSGSAMLHFVRSGAVTLRECHYGILWTLIGAVLGAGTVQLLNATLLRAIIPWLLGIILFYTLMTPRLGSEDIHARMPSGPFYLIFGLLLGFYDGFLGPGTGSFWAMAFVIFLGYSLQRATAYTKVMNFTSNVAALLFFLLAGQVRFTEGLIMGAGQFIGARIGARLVTKRGSAFIRPLFITMVVALLAKLIIQNTR